MNVMEIIIKIADYAMAVLVVFFIISGLLSTIRDSIKNDD